MRPPLGSLLLCLGLLALAGCAPPTLRSAVTAYAQPDAPGALTGRKIAIVALPGQAGSLEWDAIRRMLADQLPAWGASLAADRAASDSLMSFTYDVDGGRTEVISQPMMMNPGFPGFHRRPWGRPYAYDPPFYGDPWETEITTRTVYTRSFTLRLYDAKAAGDRPLAEVLPLNELHVESRGPSPGINRVMPAMITAALRAFPGRDGQTVTIDVPLP
ncbi:hypothetical protein [Rhodospirillum rubrum]|uniref:DUF4136 domain-containing protein n=1 Tax=Rhodospirillum rubrum (strain ATCC 11170 / ATH 1.1.1 / DSM 467 / LMG 4362 / NCIMB 8255 / S1) TaxID=269796 RepID=Q2RQC0_RHORT|nr:hypothetical protein [Rhodospirillum rubrum]ABC23675.1 hypothetical protein Rru_A2878 [Rhodospirillum rubrum ATCC 11170]AEO49413.1 hypothetical protein F11_14755 [Rhodospirillum rubrum F11]MBK5955351.1 hypothetical protein [Rhodospirillum rubrum]QXG79635.1 hypothetical protein KUL73_14825 [Rhodospirillum rubrum]HAQ00062.1 hypothetical protein [Rhodospirillum rubrum]